MRDGTLFLAKTCYGAGLGGKTDAYRDGSYDYYISETVGSYDIKGTGAYIQAACAYEGGTTCLTSAWQPVWRIL